MAFKMNRPVIKGTANHKASIAKAKAESVVSQSRTKGDASLVGAGKELGKSYIPAAIDYSIDQKGIKFLDIKKEKGVKPKSDYENYLEDIGATTGDIGEEKGVLSEKDFKQLNKQKTKKEKKVKKDKKDEALSIKPRGYKQPETKRKEELALPTQSVPSSDGQTADRFEKAAEEFGYDLSTEKGYNEAEKAMEYNDRTDEWQNPKVAVDNLESKKQGPSEEEKKIEAEVAAKQAETMKLEKQRQAEKKAIADEKKRIAEEALAEKKAKKKAEIEAKNVGIRERNEARKYFKGKTDQPATIEEKVEALREMKAKQEEALNFQPEFEEQDDPDDFNKKAVSKPSKQELEKIAYKPQVVNDKVAEPVVEESKRTGKQRRLDKKWESAGPSVRANMIDDGYIPLESKSPTQMRDNRIYRNAIKGGAVRRNMIKSGYIPE